MPLTMPDAPTAEYVLTVSHHIAFETVTDAVELCRRTGRGLRVFRQDQQKMCEEQVAWAAATATVPPLYTDCFHLSQRGGTAFKADSDAQAMRLFPSLLATLLPNEARRYDRLLIYAPADGAIVAHLADRRRLIRAEPAPPKVAATEKRKRDKGQLSVQEAFARQDKKARK